MALLDEVRRSQRRTTADDEVLDATLLAADTPLISEPVAETPAPVSPEAPTVSPSEEKADDTRFSDAFAAARKAGESSFVWHGTEYSTQTKEEAQAARKPADIGGGSSNIGAGSGDIFGNPVQDSAQARSNRTVATDLLGKDHNEAAQAAADAVPVPHISKDKPFSKASAELRKAQDQAATKAWRETRAEEIRRANPAANEQTVQNMVQEELISGHTRTSMPVWEDADKVKDRRLEQLGYDAEKVKNNPHAAAFLSGGVSLMGGVAGAVDAVVDNGPIGAALREAGVDYSHFAKFADAASEKAGLFASEVQKQKFLDADSKLDWMFTQALANAPQLALSGAAMLAPGMQPIALGVMASSSGGQQYRELVKAGVDKDVAYTAGIAYGAFEWMLEKQPIDVAHKLISRFKALPVAEQAKLGKRIMYGVAAGGTMMGVEGAEEVGTQAGQNATDILTGTAQEALHGKSGVTQALKATQLTDNALDSFMGGVSGGAVHGAVVGGGVAIGAFGGGNNSLYDAVTNLKAAAAGDKAAFQQAKETLGLSDEQVRNVEQLAGPYAEALRAGDQAAADRIAQQAQEILRPGTATVPHVGQVDNNEQGDVVANASLDQMLEEKALQDQMLGQGIAEHLILQQDGRVEPTLNEEATSPDETQLEQVAQEESQAPGAQGEAFSQEVMDPSITEDVAASSVVPPGRTEPTFNEEQAPVVEDTQPRMVASAQRATQNQDTLANLKNSDGTAAVPNVKVTTVEQLPLRSAMPETKTGRYSLDQGQAAKMKLVLEALYPGTEVVFYSTDDTTSPDGFRIPGDTDNRVFVKANDSTIAPEYVLGHEFFHAVEDGADGASVKQVYDSVRQAAGAPGIIAFGKVNPGYNPDERVSEMSADLSGRLHAPLFTRTKFWDNVFAGVKQQHGTKKGKQLIKNFVAEVGHQARELGQRARGVDSGYSTDMLFDATGLNQAFQAIGQAVRNYTPGIAGEMDAAHAAGAMGIRQSTRRIREGKENLKRFGLEPGKKYNTIEVARALEDRYRHKYGIIDRNDRSPEAMKKLADWMVDEVMYAVEHPSDSGVGWYSEKFQRALDHFAGVYPELGSDKSARDLVTALIAVTSDGQKVEPNFRQAMDVYRNYRNGGELITDRSHIRQNAIDGNLDLLAQLLDQHGPEGMHNYLLQEDTVSNLKKIAKDQDIDFQTEYQAHIELPLAAVIIGPKLGAFYANLMGSHGYLTMDRWWSRTFNRYRGLLTMEPTKVGLERFRKLIGKPDLSDVETLDATVPYRDAYAARNYKGGTEIERAANTLYKAGFENLNDTPFTATDRTFMLDVVGKAQSKLKRKGHDISIADIQAILWYYEKRLYGELGARQSRDISYEEAAQIVSNEHRGDRPAGRSVLGHEASTAGQTDTGNTAQGRTAPGRDGAGRDQSGSTAPLEGAPAVEGAHGPDPRLVAVAEQYARDNGINLTRQSAYVQVDENRARRIAQAYDEMQHAPQDPAVKEAYENLIRQTMAQYRALEEAGYRFYLHDESNDPYQGNPWNAMRDLRANKTMAVFATEAGFGTNENFDPVDNPLLADTGLMWPYGSVDGKPKRVLANDLFRAVHDAFGHGLEGAGFRAQGEENAWQAHVRLFTGSAIAAITSETRGQNSWLNYGPYGEHNQTAKVEETKFADQKTGLLPAWTWTEGRLDAVKRSDPRNTGPIPAEEEIARLRAQVAALEKELRTSPVTGLRNQRAFDEDEALGWPTVAAADMDGLKRLNTAVGHEGADTVLRALGGLLLQAETELPGVRAYHRSGDEFAFRFENKDTADRFMADLQARLDTVNVNIDMETPHGDVQQYVYEGIGLSYGIGDNYAQADHAAESNKAERFRTGKREDARANETRPPRRLRYAAPGQGPFGVVDQQARRSTDVRRDGSGGSTGQGTGYGRTQQGLSTQVTGVHYSSEPRKILDSSKYGTGMPGAEAKRLEAWSATTEQKKRIYFYVNEGEGVAPEAGVGHIPHEVQLNNLYNWKEDPMRMWQAAAMRGGSFLDTLNYVEQMVMDSGFDGYYAPGAQGKQGVAVLLGEHKVPVGVKKSIPRDPDTIAAKVAELRKMTEAQRDNLDFYDFGFPYYLAYEAETLMPKKEGTMKAVNENNSWAVTQEADAVANIDGKPWLASKYDDPDDEADEGLVVWHFQDPFDPDLEYTTDFGDKGEAVKQLKEFLTDIGVRASKPRLKDENGKDLVVYHGSNETFSAFEMNKAKLGQQGAGFYFTTRPDNAKQFGDNVTQHYLTLQRPFTVQYPYNETVPGLDKTYREVIESRDYAAFDSALKNHGYDGVVVRTSDGQVFHVAVFNPSQIETAPVKSSKPRLKDETGKDLVVYHGTHAQFDSFDFSKALDGAHWFTDNESHAGSFGPVRSFHLRMANPMTIDQDDLEAAWDKEHPDGEQDDRNLLPRDFVGDFVKQAKAQGHDGLIIQQMGDRDIQADMYLPFDASQIESIPATKKSLPRQVDTTEFKKWFGDSKVVDENGKPLVVYHGTTRAFDEFSKKGVKPNFTSPQKHLGFFFTDDVEMANRYTQNAWRETKEGANIVPVYLKLEYPRYEDISTLNEIEDKWTHSRTKQYVEMLKQRGHDGIIFEGETLAFGNAKEFVVFDATQIKSAIGNSGQFDATNPDIRRSDTRDKKTPEQLRQDFAKLVGQDNEQVVSYLEDALRAAEGDWNAAKRGVVSHEDSNAAAEALAERLGWSTDAVSAVLAQGSIDVGGQAIPATELLGAAAATTRVAIADLLDNPDAPDFDGRMASAINLMISSRANLSEIGRALSYAGWMERRPGQDVRQRADLAKKTLQEAQNAADNAIGVSGNMTDEERQTVANYNAAMRDLGDARYAAEEAREEITSSAAELIEVRSKVAEARQARDAAKHDLTKANADLRHAEKQRTEAMGKTPSSFAITQAEGAARRAENEARAAREWNKTVEERLTKAKERTERAEAQIAEARKNKVSQDEINRILQREKMAKAEAKLAENQHRDAKAKLKEAEDRLKHAQEREAKLKKDTPDRVDITRAQGAARRAEQAMEKALADLRLAQRELAKARDKVRGAKERAKKAGDRLQGVLAKTTKIKKPKFIGKGGVSRDEILAALGGKKGLKRIQEAIRNGRDIDTNHVVMFFQGVSNNIYHRKLEATKRPGTWGRVHNFLAAWLEQFRASILTGIFTHGVNILSNAVFQTIDMGITRGIGAALPGGAGVVNHYKAASKAMLRSLSDTVAAIRFGMTEEYAAAHFGALMKARPGVRQSLLDLGGNKWMDHTGGALPGAYGRIVRTVGFAPLGSMDLVFKLVPYRYSVYLQQAQGKPVDYSEAVRLAEYETFQTQLGEFTGAISQGISKMPAVGFIVPFMKTLVNLIKRSIDYTPFLGQLANIDNLAGTHGKEARNVALAQGLVAAGLAFVVLSLHGEGDDDPESKLSGTGYVDYSKQALWLSNHEQLGLKLGDWLIPLWRIEPFASMMGLTIAAKEAHKLGSENGDWEGAGKRVGAAFGNVVVGKSFMAGAEEMLQSVMDLNGQGWVYFTDRLPKSIALGSVIPNFIVQLGDATDDYKREAVTWSDEIKRRTALYRDELNPKLDYKGDPIREQRSGTILPVQRVQAKDDPVARWLLLNDVPLKARPGTIKELPYEERRQLLKDRLFELETSAATTGMDKPLPIPENETPTQRAARLEEERLLKKEARDDASIGKSEWSKDVEYIRSIYGLDSVE